MESKYGDDDADFFIDDHSSEDSNSQSLLSNYCVNNHTSPLKKLTATRRVCSSIVIDIEEDSHEGKVLRDPDRTIDETDLDEIDFEENKVVQKKIVEIKKNDEEQLNRNKEIELKDFDGNIVKESVSQKNLCDKGIQPENMKSINEINKLELQNLTRFSPGDRIFPTIRLSSMHTVAVKLKDDYKPGDILQPYPKIFEPKWNDDFVPMPCCDENVRILKKRVQTEKTDPPTKPTFTETTELLWNKIQEALSVPILNCEDLTNAMSVYCKQLRGTELNVLHHTLDAVMTKEESDRFFSTVLPGMVHLCLKLPEILTCPLPFLIKFMNHSVTLSQQQIASILANAFFCTFPSRFQYEEEFPTINFVDLFSDDNTAKVAIKTQKLRCILHYFERVTTEMPCGLVTFTRKSIRKNKIPEWSTSSKRITKLITLDEGSIETDGQRLLQVDFANRYVGGGVLSRGCVQEEILFVIYPELIVSRLFTEKLVSCEALVITGCERFSNYRGYANNFQFVDDFIDGTPWDSRGRKCTQIVAIDALYVTKHAEQFHPEKLARELTKAFIGFSYPPGTGTNVAVATGKWGCGAFKGDPYLKAVLQLLAASQVDRHVVFFTFGDPRLQKELQEIYTAIKDKTIGHIWSLLNQYYKVFCTRLNPSVNLYEFLTEYTSAEGDIQGKDDEMDVDEFEAVPPKRFYEGNASSSKLKCDQKQVSTNSNTEEFGKDDGFDDWFKGCDESKLDGTSSQNKSGQDKIELPTDKNAPLTDEQILAEPEAPMDDDNQDSKPTPSKPKKTNPFLKSNASPSTAKPTLFPKCSSIPDKMDVSPTTPKANKQKRQWSLKDYYKLQSKTD